VERFWVFVSAKLRAAAAVAVNRRTLTLAALLLLVEYVYAFLISAGRIEPEWPTYNTYYDLLADGFRAGQLDIAQAPPPELLAKENPYDPANSDLWMWDVSLYHGKYYLYWGPFPAILQAIAKSVLGITRVIGDQYLVFGFASASALFGAQLIDRVAQRLFVAMPLYVVGAAFLAFAFCNPAPYLVASPGVYQAAILGGQACTLGGVVPAFDAVWSANVGRTPRVKLLLAGMAWAAALASRVTLAPAIACLVLATALASGRAGGGRWPRVVRDLLWLGVPLAIGSFLLLLYNKLRFDGWFDFGLHFQLDTLKFVTSASYVPANLFSYFLRTPDLSCSFPFLIQWWDHGIHPLPTWLSSAEGYFVREPCVGALVVVPAIWFGVVALASGSRKCSPQQFGRSTVTHRRAYLWCVSTFVVLGSVTAAFAWCMDTATMRYLADFTCGLVLLGILGGMTLWSRSRTNRWTRAAAGTLLCVTSVATAVAGLLLGYQGYVNHFSLYNPSLDTTIVSALSMCH
jgi:hypothetical protein